MKTAYVLHDGSPCWASIDGDDVHALQGDRFAAPGRGARLGSLAEMKLLSPIEPTAKLVALLSNWRGRDGRDGPGFFIKPRSTLINPGEAIVYPPQATRVDFEAEIAVVIGRRCRNVTPAEARDFVYGYTVVNDVTAFGLGVATNFDFLYGKSFDTFGVVGPWIVDDIDPDNQRLLGLDRRRRQVRHQHQPDELEHPRGGELDQPGHDPQSRRRRKLRLAPGP